MNTEQTSGLPQSWRGWVWLGGESLLALQEKTIEAEPLQPGQVLVRNAAAGLNPVDWKVLEPKIGLAPGVDGAGTVVATGRGVAESWLGQRVAYHQNLHAAGSFAAYTPLAEEVLIRVPDALSFAQAAAIPCPALTAWQALEKLPQRAGAEVMIAGAGGSVGHFLLQLAVARGYRVTVMCHERHWQRLQALGAESCLADPVSGENQMGNDHQRRYFALIDCVGAAHALALSDVLKANGHLVCIMGRAAEWPCEPFGRALSLHEVALGALHQHGNHDDWRALTASGEQILQQLATGTLQHEQQLEFSFDQLPQQLTALQHRNFSGKQIILF